MSASLVTAAHCSASKLRSQIALFCDLHYHRNFGNAVVGSTMLANRSMNNLVDLI